MDKLNKAIETLKSQTTKKKDGPVSHKDKIILCQHLMEGIQNASVKQSSDYSKVYSSSFETLFTLCDDPHSDVRMVAEECLNGVIRNSLAEGNAGRVHIELYKEIRRNGPARSLRSALTKFADLADQIKAQKCRMFSFNLVPCLSAVARRPEDLIYECFGLASSKIFAALGQFFSDEETKILIKSILPNLQLTSAPARRCASSFLVDLCRHTRKKQYFTVYLLKSLLDTIVPVQLDQSVQQVLGTLTALRSLAPLIKECDDNDLGEVRFVQTGAIRVNPQISLSTDQLLQFYEITLYYACYPNNSVSTCALETLSAYLQNLPRRLINILQSNSGVDRSRIFSMNFNSISGRISRKPSFSLTSGSSSIGGSQTDLTFNVGSLSIDNADLNLFANMNSSSENIFPQSTTSPDEIFEKKENELFPTDNNNEDSSTMLDDEDDDDDEEENAFNDHLGIERKPIDFDADTLNIKNKRLMELGGLTKIAPEDVQLFSEPSTPLSSEGQSVTVSFPDDIGSFSDEDISLRFCCRLLCRKFLLSNDSGSLIADKDVRVSQKVLALNCVQSLCSLDPSLIGVPLIKIPLNEAGQKIKDVFLYASHSDHLLRGETACFAGVWLKAEFISGRFSSSFCSSEGIILDYFLKIVNDMLSDQHFLAARSALIALKSCQNEILSWNDEISMKSTLNLFDSALTTLRHTYWTVKLALLEMWSNLNFVLLRRCELQSGSNGVHKTNNSYQDQVLNIIINDLLSDENGRVRQEAALTLCSLVKSLCFVDCWDAAKFVRSFEPTNRTSLEFSWFHEDFSKIHNLSPAFEQKHMKQLNSWQEENLSHLITMLYRALSSSKDQFHLSGLLTSLSKLSEIYLPCQYFQSWSTFLTDCDTGAAHLSTLLQILNVAIGTEAIALHQVLIVLLGNLFAGYASRQLSKQNSSSNERWSLLSNHQLGEFASELNLHCLRILSIYWHVCSETVPSAPPMITKPPLPQLSHQSLPGGNVAQMIKSKLDGNKVQEKNEPVNQPLPQSQLISKAKVGDYYNIPHLMRLYEMIKGGWTNYKTSLDADVKERFVGLLRSCLRCLSTILEVASLNDVEKISEEILLYVKPLMGVLPSEVITTVTQVLKSLFGTNLSLSVRPDSNAIAGVPSSTSYLSVINVPSSLYQLCVVKPRTKFAQSMAASTARHDLLSDALNKHLGWFGSRADKHVLNLLKKPAHKTILTNYIRLFEPIVVQALSLYTSSGGVELQMAVINLLIQLVQIRVNYCLLDSKQKFLEFLFKQLETVDDGGVLTNDGNLVQTLFEFFIILSYEKYQNKNVLDVPKILQLADALLASGLNKNLGISALHCVIVDLFLLRSSTKLESPKDLEIQQECVISVLLKSINCVQALDLFTFILYRTRRENEAKWRKISRDIVDILLPFMSKGQFPFDNFESFQIVVNFLDFLCPGAFRPVDSILELLFSSPSTSCTDIDRFCKWLSVEYVCLYAVVVHCREDAILSRLEVLPVSFQFYAKSCENFRNCSPSPPMTTTSNSVPQDTFAQLLLAICDLSLYELLHYRRCLPQNSLIFLERLILRYLQLTTHVCQSGSFRKISASLASQFVVNWTTEVSILMKFSPQIVVQFFYLLSSVHVYNDEFWLKIISSEQENNLILRQIVRILYADHVKERIMDGGDLSSIEGKWKFDNVVDLIDEPPVSELVGVLQRCHPASQLFLNVAESYLFKNKILPRKCVKMLRCLDSLHFSSSFDVLRLLMRCLESPYIIVRQTASTMASRKIELILINRSSNDTSLKITEQQFQDVYRRLDSSKLKKFSHLRTLMLKLSTSYGVDFTLTDDNQEEICSALMKPSLKKPKFIQILQGVVRRRCVEPKNVGQILSALNVDEAAELLSDWTIKGDILEACILRDRTLDIDDDLGSPTGYPAEERSSVAVAATRALIAGIRTIFLKFPKEFRLEFNEKSFEFDSSLNAALRDISERLFDYADAVRTLLDNHQLIKTLNDTDMQILTKFCCILTMATLNVHSELTLGQTLIACECLISCFVCERSWATLCSKEFFKMQTFLIGCVYWILVKIYKFSDIMTSNADRLEIVGVDENRMIFWSYVLSMLVWLEKQRLEFNKTSENLFYLSKRLIIGVARLPYVCSFSRVPVSVFKYGWMPDVKRTDTGNLILPNIPVRFLQNVDSLHDFMFRVNLLGWSTRQDFEEVCMSLIGVLNSTPIGQELQSNSAQEITNRVCASSVAVRLLTSLFVQSLLYPVPGRPCLSKYISKQREKQSTFMKSNSGQRLFDLKRRISRSVVDFTHFHRHSPSYGRNIERLHNFYDYNVGQFSIDTLWSLTGILAEEESLVSSNSATSTMDAIPKPKIHLDLVPSASGVLYAEEPPPGVVMRRSASNFILTTENELNIVSDLKCLLDLFEHWLGSGPEAVPLPLLSATVESVVILSDLFIERKQYVWLREKLTSLNQQRSSEDELIMQDIALGLLKSSAVLGMNDAEKLKETLNFIDTGLNKRELSIRIATLQGALYVLQTLTSDEVVGFMPVLSEYILTHLNAYVVGDNEKLISDKPQSVDHQLVLWAVSCFIVESFHDPHTKQSFAPKFLEICIKAISNRNLPFVLIKAVVNGVESLLINSSLDVKSLGQLAKLATDGIQQSESSEFAILSIQLLLTCLYSAKENRRSDELTSPESEVAPRNAGEPTLSAMERLSVLLSRITKGNRKEACVIGQILPSFLSDNFSPGDVMNKIITELLHPAQPHPEIIIKILHSLIEALSRHEATPRVCEWILCTIPSFTHKNPWQFAVWCLTCFLLSSSTNVFVKNLWSIAQCRSPHHMEQLDVSLFCLAVENFCCQLEDKSQLISFFLTMDEASKRNPSSIYYRARDIISIYCDSPSSR